MSLNVIDVLEALFTILGSTLGAATVVRRVVNGPIGEHLAKVVTAAMGELVAKQLEAERPKLLQALRDDIRKLVREETEALRERLARLEGVVEGAGLTGKRGDEQPLEASSHG